MPSTDWKRIADALNRHLADARLSSQDVARRAGVDRKTVDRLRGGQAVRLQTLAWIEDALRIKLRDAPATAVGDAAPATWGGYRKDAVLEYAGEYTGYRRSFDTPGHLIASYLQIYWDEGVSALRFTDNQHNRADAGRTYAYRFGGDVLIPPHLGILHLVVRSNDGRVRLISTAMPREDRGTLTMKGFILTLNEIRDIGYYPVTSPIVFVKQAADEPVVTGVVKPGDARYAPAEDMLRDTEQRFLAAEVQRRE